MKKQIIALTVFAFIGFTGISHAQTNTTTTTTEEKDDDSCYRKWWKIFKLRGADEVTDGEYDNVIISFREGTSGNCYYGKVIVKGGKLKEINVRFADGKFEKVDFDSKEDILITNGISDPIVAHLKNQRHVLNIIFKDKLRPKGNAYDQAPDPEIDDYN